MRRILLRAAALALALSVAPASGEPDARAPVKPAPDRAMPERPSADKRAADRSAVIGCPSLANYRLLMRQGGVAAAAQIADPKADHLGCNTLPRGRLTGIADRVALGAQAYDCASVQGTAACQWMTAGTIPTLAAVPRR